MKPLALKESKLRRTRDRKRSKLSKHIKLAALPFALSASMLAHADPGGVGSNLVFWVKADTGVTGTTEVTAWNDQSPSGLNARTNYTSGNQNNATSYQQTVARPPNSTLDTVNFNPAITFDGVNDAMNIPISNGDPMMLGTADAHIFAVANPSTNGGMIFSDSRCAEENGWFVRYSAGNYRLRFSTPNGGDLATPGLAETWSMVDFSRESGANQVTFGVNGDYITPEPRVNINYSSPGTGNPSQNALTERFIGKRFSCNAEGIYDGSVAEIVMFKATLNSLQEQQIKSYLAIKYGLTLGGGGVDYLASQGFGSQKVFDSAATFDHREGITVIMRDDVSELNQKQSKSANNDAILTIGLGSIEADNAANANTFPNDLDFFTASHNGIAVSENTAQVPSSLGEGKVALARNWKVQTNSFQTTNVILSFDLDVESQQALLLDSRSNAGDYALLIDDDQDFSNATVYTTGATLANNKISFSVPATTLAGKTFTLSGIKSTAPGGIQGARLWLKSDLGVSPSAGTLTAWEDQSGFNTSVAAVNGDPQLLPAGINFNPAVAFDGGSDGSSVDFLTTVTKDIGDSVSLLIVQELDALASRSIAHGSDLDLQARTISLFGGSNATFEEEPNILQRPVIRGARGSRSGFTPVDNFADIAHKGLESVALAPGGADAGNVAYSIGASSTGADAAQGSIAEVVVYERELSDDEFAIASSYLAIKYGITLSPIAGADAGVLGKQNHLNSLGNFPGGKVYDAPQVGDAQNHVTSIARDDASGLNQKQSRAVSDGSLLTLALGNTVAVSNSANTAVFPNDYDFVTVSDTGAPASEISTDVPAAISSAAKVRLARYWRGQASEALIDATTQSEVTIAIDLAEQTGLSLTGVASDYSLLIDDNSDTLFENASVVSTGTLSGTVLSFTVNVNDIADKLKDPVEARPAFTIAGPVPIANVEFAVGTFADNESDGGNLPSLVIDGVLNYPTNIVVTIGGTATPGTDYTFNGQTMAGPVNVTIPAGNYSNQSIALSALGFAVTGEDLFEENEGISFELSSPSAGLAIADTGADGITTTASYTITNDDPQPTVSFTSATQNIAETDSGTVEVTVTATLSAVSGLDVTVPFTVGGTADASDSTAGDDTITISAGSASNSYTFDITGDTEDEGNETVTLTMGAVTNATATGITTQTITVTNDDDPASLSFTQQPSTISSTEAISPAITVSILNANGNVVSNASDSVSLAITNGTGANGATLSGAAATAAENGVATFAASSIDLAGTGYTLDATASGLTLATSDSFNVEVGPATQLVVTQSPSVAFANIALTDDVVVAVRDAGGNLVTSDNSSLTIAIGNDPSGGTAQLSGTLSAMVSNGVATFSDLTIDTAGMAYTLTITDDASNLTAATSSAFNVGTEPTAADADGDGLPDALEAREGTDVNSADSPTANGSNDADGDGITDAVEAYLAANGGQAAPDTTPSTDTDGDGIPDATEIANDTDPFDADAPVPNGTADEDDDGIPNGLEAYLETIGGETAPNTTQSTDTDNDGIPDVQEVANGTNPVDGNDPTTNGNADDDNDGVPNGLEAYIESIGGPAAPNTTLSTDTDNDGVPDVEEIQNGNDPTDADDPAINGNGDDDNDGIPNGLEAYLESIGGETAPGTTQSTDTDNDGVPDVQEIQNGGDPTDANDPTANGGDDDDNDGVPNGLEAYLESIGGSSSPGTTLSTDTDNDGIPDVQEVQNGTDPTDGNDPVANGSGDDDNDGVPNGLEAYIESIGGPAAPGTTLTTDTDNDGVPDVQEVLSGNDPINADSPANNGAADEDDDGIPNGLEEYLESIGGSPAPDTTLSTDTDSDGIPDVTEVANGTDPIDGTDPSATGSADDDDDGIPNGLEAYLESIGGAPAPTTTTSTDTDGDGIPDVTEVANGTNPVDGTDPSPTGTADEDDDGIPNGLEAYLESIGGSPAPDTTQSTDTDGDGIPDVTEVANGTDPIDSTDPSSTGSADSDDDGIPDGLEEYLESIGGSTAPNTTLGTDTDGDGIPDVTEVANGTDPIDATDPSATGSADDDDDGIPNGLEAYLESIGGSPAPDTTASTDTDGDGIPDVIEVANGTDPIDANDPQNDVGDVVDLTNDGTPGNLTEDDLMNVGLVMVDPDLLDQYESEIANAMPAPTTTQELQEIINRVNDSAGVLNAVLEGSSSNGNAGTGTPVTADELQMIIGVDPMTVNPALEAQYQAAIAAETGFSNPPTAAEVQAIIDSVNALANVLEDSASMGGATNRDGMPITVEELQAIAGISSVSTALEAEYQAAILAENGFSNPPTLAEVQAIIDAVNAANGDDDGDGVTNDMDTTCPNTTMNLAVDNLGCPTVAGIIAASNNPADGGFTLEELARVGLTDLATDDASLAAYEVSIASASPAPTTLAELQAIVNAVSDDPNTQILLAVLEDSGSIGGSSNADGNPVTVTDLRAITGLVRIKEGNEAIYQQAIAAETGFSSPPTLAEVQAVIDRNTDTDNDGISDFDEQASGNVDSDGDGIADFEDARDDRDTLKTQVDGAGSLSLAMFLALIALMILHRHKRAGMVVATAAAFAATASAQAGDCLQDKKVCFYVGAGAGISHLSPEDDSNTWEAGDKRDGGFHGLVGLKFHPRWLAELKYADLGEAGLTSDTRTADTNIPLSELYPDIGLEYTATSLMGGFIVNDPAYAVDLILKLGAVTLDNSPVNDRRAGDSQSRIAYEQVEDISVAYGVSLWYGKDDNPIGLRLDFDRYDEDASYLNASIVYSFK